MFGFGKKKADKEAMENVVQKEVEKKSELIGTLTPKKNHTLFKVHKKTLEISKADYKLEKDIHYDKALNNEFSKKKSVIVDKDYVYISCLNVKNVKKILIRDYNINPNLLK